MSNAEKFIQEHTRKCSNLMQVPTLDDKGNIVPKAHPWLTPDDARKAVEIAKEEIYKWLLKNAHIYASGDGLYTHSMINDLKQSMKDE